MICKRFRQLFSIAVLSGLFLIAGCNKEKTTPDEDWLHPSVAEHWQEGQVFHYKDQWLVCEVGSMPLVISAPHGGRMKPSEIPDRQGSGITTALDTNTEELAWEIARVLAEQYGVRPYVVTCNLRRTKIDLNRDINEATGGNPAMQKVWDQYHAYLDTALHTAVAKHGRALYIDLHAHGHDIQRLEIGYLLNSSDLSYAYSGANLATLAQKSSLQNLLRLQPQASFQDLLIGDEAFGTLMDAEGFPSVPSKHDPYPQLGESFFAGGYNTKRYTGSDYPNVYGWQIEANMKGVRDTPQSRTRFSQAFAKVITQYLTQTAH